MGLRSLKQLVTDCYDEGRNWSAFFRKVPAIASTAGIWSDLSGSPGTPKPNYFTGVELTSTAFDFADGLWHGGNVAPATKHLHKILMGSVSAGHAPGTFILCDYLIYYPLIDMDSTDEQFFSNTIDLPNYADGEGVQMFLVATNPYIGGQGFSIKYTDTEDVVRTTQYTVSNTATLIGTLINAGSPTVAGSTGPFIAIPGAKGVKNAQSITFYGPNGGLAVLVLVKPMATVALNENSAFVEVDFLTTKPRLPRVYDGAFLGLIGVSGASWAASPLVGLLDVIWASD